MREGVKGIKFECLYCGYVHSRYGHHKGLMGKPPRQCTQCYKFLKVENRDYRRILPENSKLLRDEPVSKKPVVEDDNTPTYNPNELLDILKE